MTDSEKLVKAKNLIRYIVTQMYLPFDIEFRTNDDFRTRISNDGVKIGIFNESQSGLFYLTDEEIYRKPRHRGKQQ